jgi:hypothetical protein
MMTVPPAIVERIDASLASINADDASQLQQSFAAGAPVVDNFSPFLWNGPDSAARWWKAIDRNEKRTGMHGLHATKEAISDCRLDREGDDAYVVTRVHIRFASGTTATQDGLWIVTLHRSGTGWKITSAAWSTKA